MHAGCAPPGTRGIPVTTTTTTNEIAEASAILERIIAAMPPEDTAPTNERAAYLRGALAAWHVVVPGA